MNPIVQAIFTGVLEGNAELVRQKVPEALASGVPPATVLNEGMIAAMAEVGRLFEAGEYFVPEMLIAARAMKTGTEILKPHLQEAQVKSAGKVVLGTVKGDLHDIGKNLVGIMLQGAGFEVIDLGKDVPPERFVETAVEHEAPVIGMSALLTTTMVGMKEVVEILRARCYQGKIKTIVGGAPVSAGFARDIGADDYGFDAASAVTHIKALLGAA